LLPSLLKQAGSWASIESFPVLLYHRVGPEPDALTITEDRLMEDLRYLADRGYHAVSLEQAEKYMTGQDTINGKPVLLTFDDGYLNNYTKAFPILQDFSMTATFFIITGMVGQPNRLNRFQMKEMAAAGMSFGSHTVSHRPLGDLDGKQAIAELVKSKGDLEDMLGKKTEFVAYPCGSFKHETILAARDAGYKGGFTTQNGIARFYKDHLMISRIPVFRHDHSLSLA